MKFLIDAQLPPSLRGLLRDAGHDALHTLDLPERNASRDGVLNEVSVAEKRVVITKDTDFYHSHLLSGRPWKLVLVKTGNLQVKATLEMFRVSLSEIVIALETCTLVELYPMHVNIVV
jgi:predicted nuclease of predicted toxin-antitoxin system